MYKWFMFVLFVVACTVGLVTMVYNSSIPTEEELEAAEAADGKLLRLVATNYQFDQPEYTVAAGETMTVRLQNKEGKHALEIEGLGISLQAGESKEVTFDKPGTYDIVCTLPCGEGHATMRSKLIVQ